jgi:hypothetical protein
LDLADFKNLLTDHGQEALQSAEERQPAEQDYMAHFDQLSRSFPPSLARAALETAILRL